MIGRNLLKRDLQVLLAVIAALLLTGIMFIYSSSSVYCLEQYGNAHYSVQRHLVGILIGFIGLFIGWVIPVKVIKKISPYAFLSALVLTSLTLVPLLGHRI